VGLLYNGRTGNETTIASPCPFEVGTPLSSAMLLQYCGANTNPDIWLHVPVDLHQYRYRPPSQPAIHLLAEDPDRCSPASFFLGSRSSSWSPASDGASPPGNV
jgi:hypothetical protein